MKITITPLGKPEQTLVLVDGYAGNNRDRTGFQGDQLGLVKQGLEGWYESVVPRINVSEVPGSDGAYWPAETLLAPRHLVIRGAYTAGRWRSQLSVGLLRDRLASWIRDSLEICVEDEMGTRTVQGVLVEQIGHKRHGNHIFEFSLIVTCPDPVKYSPALALPIEPGQTIVLENVGTAGVAPRLWFDTARAILVEYAGGRFEWENARQVDGVQIDLGAGVACGESGEPVGRVFTDSLGLCEPGQTEVTVSGVFDGGTVLMRSGWL